MSDINRRKFIQVGTALSAIGLVEGCNRGSTTPEAGISAPRSDADPTSFELAEITISDLRDGMKSGKYTCRSITEMYLKRIDALNTKGPRLYSVLETNPD